jgi:hypothetical protein
MAASCSDWAAWTRAITSSGEKKSRSPEYRSGRRATSATGFEGRFQTRRAHSKTPWSMVRILFTVRRERPLASSSAAQASTCLAVTVSIDWSPKRVTMWASTTERYSLRVEALTPRSHSECRSHSWAASLTVTAELVEWGAAPRRASARIAAKAASAICFV